MFDDEIREEEERPESYFIPDNYTESGRLFNGMFDTRKFFEAAIITVVIGFLEKVIIYDTAVNKTTPTLIMIATLMPIFFVCLIGINGDPFTVFVRSLFTFLKNRRKMRFKRIVVKDGEKKKK